MSSQSGGGGGRRKKTKKEVANEALKEVVAEPLPIPEEPLATDEPKKSAKASVKVSVKVSATKQPEEENKENDEPRLSNEENGVSSKKEEIVSPKVSVPRVEPKSSENNSKRVSVGKPSVGKISVPRVEVDLEKTIDATKRHKKKPIQSSAVSKRNQVKAEEKRLKAEEEADNARVRVLNLPIPSNRSRLSPLHKIEKKPEKKPEKKVETKKSTTPKKSSVASQVFPSVERSPKKSSPRRSPSPRSVTSRSRSSSRSRTPTPKRRSTTRRSRSRRSSRRRSPSDDEESTESKASEREPLSVDNEEEEPPTEEELQDEYRALIKRLKRTYPYLDLDIPALGTSSKRLKRLYRNAVDEVGSAEGLEKYKILMAVGFALLEVLGRKIGLPCDDYAELQMKQIHSYNAMLIEFGDRDYFGFARAWPVEARLVAMMLINMLFLIIGRLLLEPDTMKKLVLTIASSRSIPAPNIDVPPAQDPDGSGEAAPSASSGSSNPLAGLLGAGGAGGGLNGILSMLMGAIGGGTPAPPARDRSEQAGPTYQRRRRRERRERTEN